MTLGKQLIKIIGSPGGATGSEPTAQKMRKHFFVTEASVESIESQQTARRIIVSGKIMQETAGHYRQMLFVKMRPRSPLPTNLGMRITMKSFSSSH